MTKAAFKYLIYMIGAFSIFLPTIAFSQIPRFSQSGSVQHPRAKFYPYSPQECIHLDINNKTTKPTNVAFLSAINRLKTAILVDSIGVLEEVDEEVFGRIVDIESDKDGNVYILDFEFAEVRVFDKNGNHLITLGAPGQAPGEFQQPQFLAVDSLGAIYVLDSHAVLSRFNNDGTFISSSRDREYFSDGLAIANQTIFKKGVGQNSTSGFFTIKSVLSQSDNVTFGKAYNGESFSINARVNGQGELESVGHNIIESNLLLPFITSFTAEGTQNWVIQLDNYQQWTFDAQGGVMNLHHPVFGDTYISNITAFDNQYFVVQINVSGLSTQTWLIDSQTGAGFFVSDKLPILDEITSNGFYIQSGRNYPQVKYYKFKD